MVGVEEAARILAKLESDQVERISWEIATIRTIDPVEAEALIANSRALLSNAGLVPRVLALRYRDCALNLTECLWAG
ncbi:hypothetical protein MASR2M78_16910 [Treponema sp.]